MSFSLQLCLVNAIGDSFYAELPNEQIEAKASELAKVILDKFEVYLNEKKNYLPCNCDQIEICSKSSAPVSNLNISNDKSIAFLATLSAEDFSAGLLSAEDLESFVNYLLERHEEVDFDVNFIKNEMIRFCSDFSLRSTKNIKEAIRVLSEVDKNKVPDSIINSFKVLVEKELKRRCQFIFSEENFSKKILMNFKKLETQRFAVFGYVRFYVEDGSGKICFLSRLHVLSDNEAQNDVVDDEIFFEYLIYHEESDALFILRMSQLYNKMKKLTDFNKKKFLKNNKKLIGKDESSQIIQTINAAPIDKVKITGLAIPSQASYFVKITRYLEKIIF